MILIFYAAVILGFVLLWADVTGRFRIASRRLRVWRGVGLAAAGAAFAFDVWALANLDEWSYEPSALFWLVVLGHPLGAAIYAVTLITNAPRAVLIRRITYAIWLALAALPSWAYLPLAMLVGMAGFGLAGPRDRAAHQTIVP